MVVCFFGKTGHVATVPLEHRRKVNSEWYTTICLAEVFGEIRKTNKKKKVRVDWCKEILEKYDRGASKDVYKIVTGDESWIRAYEPDTR